jgi:hypothetical protein
MSEYDKKRYRENKESEKKRAIAYYYANKRKCNLKSRNWRIENPDKVKDSNKKWYSNNIDKAKQHSKTIYYKDRKKALAINRSWYDNNKDKAKHSYLQRKYGMTFSEYNSLLQQQSGVCAICFTKEVLDKSLIVDHCHQTGKVRGLLCDKCNFAIGLLKDNPETIMSAFNYIIKNNG